MKNGFIFKELRLTGLNKVPAKVLFARGLNVIAGPTDTGKTYIFQCLNYMLGSKDLPKEINQAKGYTAIFLEIEVIGTGIFTLESDFKRGAFKLYNGSIDFINKGEELQSLSRRHNPENDNNLSSYLLTINNILGKKIKTNAKGSTRSISYRDLVPYLLVDETKITTEKSPIVDEDHYTTGTTEESVFKFIITGYDDSDVIQEISKEEILNKKGKIELLSEQINELEIELVENRDIKLLNKQIDALDSVLNLHKDQHSILLSEFENLNFAKKEIQSDYNSVSSKNIYLNEIYNRSKILEEQYINDIARLETTIEASFLLTGGHTLDSNCPLCKQKLSSNCEEVDIHNIISSCNSEIAKINALFLELKASQNQIAEEIEDNAYKLSNLREQIDSVDRTLNDNISTNLSSTIERIEIVNTKKSILFKDIILLKRLESLIKQKDYYERLIPNTGIKSSNKISTSTMLPLANEIKAVLLGCNYSILNDITYSEGKKDFVINGEDRKLSGKGMRAITYAAFIIGLQELIHDRDYSIGVPVLDSPLVTYKKPKHRGDDIISSDLAMDFYRYAANNNHVPQIIIIENEEPPNDILHKINYIEFTRSREYGRYGFIPE